MKRIELHTLLAGLTMLMVSSASAVSITDSVEPNDGWSQIQPANSFNSFTASSGGLTPQSGTNFWKSGFPNNNNFGTYKEFDATFTEGTMTVTYSIGDLDSNTWPGEIGSRLFIASDGEGNFGSTWLNRVETPVANRNRPTPGDGEWVTCTDTYYITSDTEDAAGNPVIGEKIGFVVIKKLSGGTGGQAYAFDNLTIEIVTPTSSGVDLRAYQAADGVYVEFVAYDVEADGTIRLAQLNDDGTVAWEGSVAVTAGPRYIARFLVPELEPGGVYNFSVRDEVGKWWSVDGVTVGSFDAELVSASLTGITITFDSIPENEYEIQWAAELGDSWVKVAEVSAASESTSVEVAYPDPEAPSGVFRVVALP